MGCKIFILDKNKIWEYIPKYKEDAVRSAIPTGFKF